MTVSAAGAAARVAEPSPAAVVAAEPYLAAEAGVVEPFRAMVERYLAVAVAELSLAMMAAELYLAARQVGERYLAAGLFPAIVAAEPYLAAGT